VDRGGHQLLAGAGLGEDHHRHRRRGHRAREGQRAIDRGVGREQRGERIVDRRDQRARRDPRRAILEVDHQRDHAAVDGRDRIDERAPRPDPAGVIADGQLDARGGGGQRLGQERLEAEPEHRLGARADRHRAEQLVSGGVGAGDPPRWLDQQHRPAHPLERLGQRARHRGAGAGVGALAQRVLERARRRGDGEPDHVVDALERRGRVEHAQRAAVGPVHRRRVAHQVLEPPAVVGVALDRGRPRLGQRRADRVGAARRLAPARALDQPQPAGLVGERAAAPGRDHDAVGIGEQQQVAALGQERLGLVERAGRGRGDQPGPLGVLAQRRPAQQVVVGHRAVGGGAQRVRALPALDHRRERLRHLEPRGVVVEPLPQPGRHVVEEHLHRASNVARRAATVGAPRDGRDVRVERFAP
jgi:hypothetical protein